MMDNVLLSLCIPTNGAARWVLPLLDSIYAQGADERLFEVVITDNAASDVLARAVGEYRKDNLHYWQTSSSGFTNQLDAFEKCTGIFCKMLNHRSILLPGSVDSLLDIARKYGTERPVIYCSNGELRGEEFIACESVDAFVRTLGVRTTWSAGTCAWKEDLSDMRNKAVDATFPHTLFLFGLRPESRYVIWNGVCQRMQDETGKGGYDVFHAFAVTFPDILSHLRYHGRISKDTFLQVKKELFAFLRTIYVKHVILPSDCTFIIRDVKKSLSVYYGKAGYRALVATAWLSLPGLVWKAAVKRVKKLFGK
ncbi:MAG: hypothetical protein IJK79_08875 [Bacteroidales bacterium]|nr:hypothetical protein [Bacteroidales bacterium]